MFVAHWKNRAKSSLLAEEGTNMKLSPKVHSQISPEQFQAWNPAELSADMAVSQPQTQREQILAIFQGEAESGTNQLGDHSALHKGEENRSFDKWQPGEMKLHSFAIPKIEWNFVGSAEVPHQSTQGYRGFEFAGFDTQNQSDPEKEVSTILEQARHKAEEIILAAQAEADNVLLQAQDEIEEQKKEAYQQGREQSINEIEDALKATRSIVEEVQGWKTELVSQGERILVEMLKEIAQKMFGEGVELNPSALQINLNRVMESAQNLGDLNIFLNPQDAKALDPSWSEYQMLVSGDKVKIVPSGKITRGGCFVKGSMGIVDGRVETQLNAILETFNEHNEVAE
jgi:flagellar assembly protein FliH